MQALRELGRMESNVPVCLARLTVWSCRRLRDRVRDGRLDSLDDSVAALAMFLPFCIWWRWSSMQREVLLVRAAVRREVLLVEAFALVSNHRLGHPSASHFL